MKINNLDAGLRKTLVAAFRSKGLSKVAADAKSSKHLKAAATHFNVQLAEHKKTAKAISRPTVDKLAAASTGRAKLALARDLFDNRKASSSDNPQTVRAALRSVAAWAKTR